MLNISNIIELLLLFFIFHSKKIIPRFELYLKIRN